ncbi:MAG: DUF3048 domain-containing protein [Acidimicrobiales bacterium]|jgi:hypothetical protein
MAGSSAHARRQPNALQRLQSKVALWWRQLDLKGRIATSVAGALVVALIATGVVSLSGSSGKAALPTTTTSTTTTSSTTTVPQPHVVSHVCPLTGTPAIHGKVPDRPALGVKIGNDPDARPQTGLPDADIVYEEMAEGGITRYLAIFQCRVPPAIGPTRSVRWDDWHILASYHKPILAFAGGIDPWEAMVSQLASEGKLFDANGLSEPQANAYYRMSNRSPPENYYTSGAALWKLDAANRTPPPRQFLYTAGTPHEAAVAAGATVSGFDDASTVQWKWDARAKLWMRYVGGVPDVDSSGSQLHATNVIIELVDTQPGPYAESGTVPDVESITEGSGPAWILRDGKVEIGTWSTPAYGALTTFRFTGGELMTLAPGNTWVELVPNQRYPVSIQH